jgi:Cu2+-containing amine oxidase
LSAHELDGQPLATPDDCLEAEAVARRDIQVQQMVADRGVDFSKVACDPWAIHACPLEWKGRRCMQVKRESGREREGQRRSHAVPLQQFLWFVLLAQL